jgi:hypothetical protein
MVKLRSCSKHMYMCTAEPDVCVCCRTRCMCVLPNQMYVRAPRMISEQRCKHNQQNRTWERWSTLRKSFRVGVPAFFSSFGTISSLFPPTNKVLSFFRRQSTAGKCFSSFCDAHCDEQNNSVSVYVMLDSANQLLGHSEDRKCLM